MFISIFGPDGVGKSTQVKVLVNYFLRGGLEVKVVWIKSRHTLVYFASKMFEKISPKSLVLNPEGTVVRINPINNSSLSRSIWVWMEFISILPCVVLRVYLPLLLGIVVVAERYLIDSIVSIAYSVDDSEFDSSLVARLMMRFIPENSVLIHLDSNYKEIKKRRGNLADSKEFIDFQRSMYSRLSKSFQAAKLDTSETDVETTARTIIEHLNV